MNIGKHLERLSDIKCVIKVASVPHQRLKRLNLTELSACDTELQNRSTTK
jgi:hypothetical protein